MRFKLPTPIQAAFLALCLLIPGCLVVDAWRHHIAQECGEKDAKGDLADGLIVYRLRGLRRIWEEDAAKAAADRFGIRIIRTGGCICSEPDCSYDMAYNQIVEEHLTARLGFNPIPKVFDEARQAWK